jgi:hypothetical protein
MKEDDHKFPSLSHLRAVLVYTIAIIKKAIQLVVKEGVRIPGVRLFKKDVCPEVTVLADNSLLDIIKRIRKITPGKLMPAPAVLCENCIESFFRNNKFAFEFI